MFYISKHLEQLYHIFISDYESTANIQPFNSLKEQNALFLTKDRRLVPLYPYNNGILPAPFSSINAHRVLDFPDVDHSWYMNGLPNTLNPVQEFLTGDICDVLPIRYIAKQHKIYSLSGLSNNSYWIKDGKVYNDKIRVEAFPGEVIATAMYSMEDYENVFKDTKVISKGSWELIKDYGISKPYMVGDKAITLTKGITEEEAIRLSHCIGYKDGTNGTLRGINKLSVGLSKSLLHSFKNNMQINKKQEINTTLRFESNNKPKRLGIYQFIRSFEMMPSLKAYEYIKSLNDSSTINELVSIEIYNDKIYYPTSHFQKVFVVSY